MTDAERLAELRADVRVYSWVDNERVVWLLAQLAAVLAERDEARAEVAALVRQQLVDTRRSFEEVQP